MPHSLVINFTPISTIPVGYTSGKHLHALFLNLVNSVDAELAEYFHNSEANKSFTVSCLQHNNHIRWINKKDLKAGFSYWFRVSLLDDTLFAKLTKLWLNLNPVKAYHLGSGDLMITSVLSSGSNEQFWANFISYEEIYDSASETERNIKFSLVTPTAFRQGKNDNFLPTVDSVFSSLLNRWQKYSSIPFNDLSFDCLFPSYFNINTEFIANVNNKFIGCVGNINYRILGDVEPIQIKQINALADYAFFCGLGRKTTMGMGMSFRVNS
jgi:CRISPR-associated endoribonuclease Cas6